MAESINESLSNKMKNFSSTGALTEKIHSWNQSKKHNVVGPFGARIIGVIATPVTSVIDGVVHLIFATATLTTGVIVFPYNLVVKPFSKKYAVSEAFELRAFAVHLHHAIGHIGNMVPLTIIVLLNPTKGAQLLHGRQDRVAEELKTLEAAGKIRALKQEITDLKKNPEPEIIPKVEEKELKKVLEEKINEVAALEVQLEKLVNENQLLAKAEQQAKEQACQQAEQQAKEQARQQAEQQAKEQARQQAEQQAKEQARQQVEQQAKEQARQQAEQQAKEQARQQAEQQAKEQARQQAEQQAKEQARQQAEQQAKEQARQQAEQQAKEQARQQAEQQAKEQARQQAEQQAKEQARQQAEQQAKEQARQQAEQQAKEQARQQAEQQAKEQARQQAEQQAKEQARQQAEQQAKEQARQLAEQQAKEQARQQAEQQAKEQARQQAEQQAKEQARQQAEQQAKEQARQLAEQQAKEQARQQAEQQAKEQARQQAEQQAKEQARQQAEQQAKEQAQQQAEQQAKEQAKLQAEQQLKSSRKLPPKPEPKVEIEPKLESKTSPEPKPEPKFEPKADSEPKPEPQLEIKPSAPGSVPLPPPPPPPSGAPVPSLKRAISFAEELRKKMNVEEEFEKSSELKTASEKPEEKVVKLVPSVDGGPPPPPAGAPPIIPSKFKGNRSSTELDLKSRIEKGLKSPLTSPRQEKPMTAADLLKDSLRTRRGSMSLSPAKLKREESAEYEAWDVVPPPFENSAPKVFFASSAPSSPSQVQEKSIDSVQLKADFDNFMKLENKERKEIIVWLERIPVLFEAAKKEWAEKKSMLAPPQAAEDVNLQTILLKAVQKVIPVEKAAVKSTEDEKLLNEARKPLLLLKAELEALVQLIKEPLDKILKERVAAVVLFEKKQREDKKKGEIEKNKDQRDFILKCNSDLKVFISGNMADLGRVTEVDFTRSYGIKELVKIKEMENCICREAAPLDKPPAIGTPALKTPKSLELYINFLENLGKDLEEALK